MKQIIRHAMMVLFALTMLLPSQDIAVTETFTVDRTMGEEGILGTELRSPRTINPIHMVVVFTKFSDELPGETALPTWTPQMFDGQPGSVGHYFDTISQGQIQVTGEVFPNIIEMPRDTDYYSYTNTKSDYVLDALNKLDIHEYFDFSMYDNDGPDGIPASGDDDGYVDYLVLMPIGANPRIANTTQADGIAHLPIGTYTTRDKDADLSFIKVDGYSGSIVNGRNFSMATGVICHEFIHSFGIPDLYDYRNDDEETESAGIGFWGIMGHGSAGWNWHGGPVFPSAYTRMLLNCIGPNNDNMIDVYGIHRNLRIRPSAAADGFIYRIFIDRNEFFLVEYRRRDGSYYDRNNPADGLLIWHVLDHSYLSNNTEEMKKCDLECADGRYLDAGFPKGKTIRSNSGRDNLDFWSKQAWYNKQFMGNQGDATDLFDGVTYTEFGPFTNPNSNSKQNDDQTGVRIFNIRQDGDEMVFDVDTAPFIDWSTIRLPLIGTGYNRFNQVFEGLVNTSKPATDIYLVTPEGAHKPTLMVLDYPDSIAVQDIGEVDQYDIQTLIEAALTGVGGSFSNRLLIRETVTAQTLERQHPDVLHALRADQGRIQKISANSNQESRPEIIELHQNYPNPFNGETTIPFTLSQGRAVTIDLFNVLGQRVHTLDLGYRGPGAHYYRFVPDGLASGVYLVRLSGSLQSNTRRLVYIR